MKVYMIVACSEFVLLPVLAISIWVCLAKLSGVLLEDPRAPLAGVRVLDYGAWKMLPVWSVFGHEVKAWIKANPEAARWRRYLVISIMAVPVSLIVWFLMVILIVALSRWASEGSTVSGIGI